ncbi:unnamed protein product [Colletotrichum tofieldiae]|nr:unnamed protein product [Colletotrichum tofieldiae]
MPVIINEVNGKLLRPKVLANTKQLAREIGGLIRETSAFTSTYKPIAPFRILDVPTGEYTLSSKDEKSIKVEFMTGAMTTYRENLEQGLVREHANRQVQLQIRKADLDQEHGQLQASLPE